MIIEHFEHHRKYIFEMEKMTSSKDYQRVVNTRQSLKLSKHGKIYCSNCPGQASLQRCCVLSILFICTNEKDSVPCTCYRPPQSSVPHLACCNEGVTSSLPEKDHSRNERFRYETVLAHPNTINFTQPILGKKLE